MLVLTVALVGPHFVDWTSYRADFEREAGRILGRDVSVEGSASARLLPFPSVTFTDVVVAGSTPDEPSMTIETFSMDAELAPFLRGEVLIFDMRLERPRAILDIDDEGQVDWAVRPSVPLDVRQVTLENVTVSEGQVTLRHAASGRTHLLSEINARLAARTLGGPWRVDGSLRIDGTRTSVALTTGVVSADGSMRVRLRGEPERYPIALEADGDVRMVDGRPRYTGQFKLDADDHAVAQARAQAVRDGSRQPLPTYRFSGRFALDHERFDIAEFRLESGPAQDPYTAEGSARFELGTEPSFLVRADGAQVRFQDATATERPGGTSFEDRLASIREFVLDLPRPTIPGRVEVRLPAIVAGDTTIRDVHLSAAPSTQGWRIDSLGASLPGRTTLEASGDLAVADELGFEGSLLVAVGQPSGFAAWLARDVDDAIRRLPSAGFSAEVSLSQERQHFRDLELVLGPARFVGEIDHRLPPGARPSMSLSLDGDRLDLDGMAAFASLFVSDAGVNRLAGHDLAFDVKAGPVAAGGLEADTLDMALRLNAGQVEIDRLSIGGLAGANVSATGSLRGLADAPTGSIDATLVAPDLEPLVTLLAQRFPGNAAAVHLAASAQRYPGLLRDADLDIVASAADLDGEAPGIALTASGSAGGTLVSMTGSVAGARGGLASLPVKAELTLRNEEAGPVYALLGLPALPVDFAGALDAFVSLDGVLGEGAATRLALNGVGLEAEFLGQTTGRGDGFDFKGTGRIASDDIEPWLVTAGLSLPGAEFGLPVSLSADLDYGQGLLVVSDLAGTVADIRLDGDLNAELSDGVPHLSGALALGTLDLALAAESLVGADAVAQAGEGWPSAPFASSPLVPFTTDVEIAAERLFLGANMPLRDARFGLRLGRDGVVLAGLTGALHGGRLSGGAEFRNDGGTGLFSAQFNLRDAALDQVLPGTGLRGGSDIAGSVTSSGKSVEGVVASLTGSGTVSLRDLAIPGLNPGALLRLVEEADKAGAEIDAATTARFAPEIVGDGVLRADALDLAFTIASGVVRAPPFLIETATARLGGEVRADLASGTVAADVTLAFDPGEEALIGSEPAVRFVVEGPLRTASATIDTEPLAQFLTQRALEREQARVEAMQALLLERQRHRREIRYYAALQEQRQRAEDERARFEAERLRRLEEEALRQREEQQQREAEEAARAATEALEREQEDLRREQGRALYDQVEDLLEALPDLEADAEAQAAPEPEPDVSDRPTLSPPLPDIAPAPQPEVFLPAPPEAAGGASSALPEPLLVLPPPPVGDTGEPSSLLGDRGPSLRGLFRALRGE